MIAQKISEALGGKDLGNEQYLCSCPVPSHGKGKGDQNPSLSVKGLPEGKVLLNCKAGCSFEAISGALRERGLWALKPFERKEKSYVYQRRSDGLDRLCVKRIDEAQGKKQFSQFTIASDGTMTAGKPKKEELLPYRFKENQASPQMIIVEGEKCADSVLALGLPCTTFCGGSNGWEDHYAPLFAGKTVTILEDNDKPGRKFAFSAYKGLEGVAASVRWVSLPGLNEGEDVVDWLQSGGTKEALLEIIQEAHKKQQSGIKALNADRPHFRCLSDIEPREVDWLWSQRIPRKCVTLIEGDGGIGKSFGVAAIVSDLTAGRALPGDKVRDPINVLLLALEDDPEVVLRPRYEAMKADCARIYFYDQSFVLSPEKLGILEAEIVEKKAQLVVIDPVVAYFSGDQDTNKSTDVRGFMLGLHEIAKRQNMAILAVRHWNKNAHASASQRGAGSVDFRNASRSVLQVIKYGEERYLALEKSNYAARAKTLSFSIKDGVLIWGDESDRTADEILAEMNQNRESETGQREEAKDFLLKRLQFGPVPSKELQEEAKQVFDISEKTLQRAKKDLEIDAVRIDNKWHWRLASTSREPRRSPSLAQKRDHLDLVDHLESKNQIEFEVGAV